MPRATSAIYFLFDGDLLIYVGQTRNLARRIKQHRTEGWKFFDSWGAIKVARYQAGEMENYYINKYKPRYNGLERLMRPRKYLVSRL